MNLPRDTRTIVVIDADPALLLQAREAFGAAGLQVVSFDDGQRALDYLRSHRDDVEAAFTDVGLCGPWLGVKLANAIVDICPHIAVIATADQSTERPPELNPQVRYFEKPWDALDIVNAMQDIALDD